MAHSSIQLGLYFFGNKIRMVEARKELGTIQVVNVAEKSIETPLDFYSIENQELVPTFTNYLTALMHEATIQARRVNFALERRMAIVKRLVVDKGLSESELRHHIEWELEQLLISSRDEYNVAFEPIASTQNDFTNIVIVAVRKPVIEGLRNIFSQTPFELVKVEIDLFPTVRGILGHFGQKPKGLVAIVDLNERGIDFTLCQDGLYSISSEIPAFQSNHDQSVYSNGRDEELAIRINDELSRLFAQIENEQYNTELNSILLTGEKANPELISYLQNFQKYTHIEFANPFRHVQRKLSIAAETTVTSKADKFLVNIGLFC
jgi:Tfp pilus assembly PilM family ATPase